MRNAQRAESQGAGVLSSRRRNTDDESRDAWRECSVPIGTSPPNSPLVSTEKADGTPKDGRLRSLTRATCRVSARASRVCEHTASHRDRHPARGATKGSRGGGPSAGCQSRLRACVRVCGNRTLPCRRKREESTGHISWQKKTEAGRMTSGWRPEAEETHTGREHSSVGGEEMDLCARWRRWVRKWVGKTKNIAAPATKTPMARVAAEEGDEVAAGLSNGRRPAVQSRVPSRDRQRAQERTPSPPGGAPHA